MWGHPHQQGFTLIELVVVIVLIGILGVMVSVFMRAPVESYFASLRRAAMTDAADTAVRRMARDIRKALPNSLRTPNNQCVELIATKTGGRYRADESPAALSFDAADTGFNLLGSNAALPADQRIGVGDVVAVYNLGIPGADAYNQDNTATITSAPTESGSPLETSISIQSKLFPFASANNRFHVIPAGENIVSYVCSGGTLHRTVTASFNSNCPASGPVLTQNVSGCNFTYDGPDLQRNALLHMLIQLTDAGETISLQSEVHVNNTP